MDLSFTEEHQQLRELVRRFLDECSDEQAVRAQMDTEEGFDRSVWTRMAEELGLLGLMVPEEQGGTGLGAVELAIVMEEMGRSLLCAPYFSTVVLGGSTLLESGDEELCQETLPKMAQGELFLTLAIEEENGGHALSDVHCSAKKEGDHFLLTGIKTPVVDGCLADLVLVAARTEKGLSLFRVEAGADGMTRKPLPPLDTTRKLARIELQNTPAQLIGQEGSAEAVLDYVLDVAAVALSAESTGGAQACLDMAVQYAKERLQFGRPIGSFQAIKHKCADMLVQVESARSASYSAAFSAVQDAGELSVTAAIAKSKASEAYFFVAAENIQVHGGIGFTWEHPAHLYFKRAKSSEVLLGEPAFHRQKLAALIDL